MLLQILMHSFRNAASLSWCLSRLFRADQLTARAFLFLLKIEQLVGAQHLCHPVTVMRSLVEKLQSETDVCRSKVVRPVVSLLMKFPDCS